MLGRRLMFVVLFIVPLQAWSAYDVEKIKSRVLEQDLFKVSDWQHANNKWKAVSSLRGAVLQVGEQKTEYVLPFINPLQKSSAKAQCSALALVGLTPDSDEERARIDETIEASIQRHVLKFTDLNGVRFTISARLVGPIVQLFCDLKPKA